MFETITGLIKLFPSWLYHTVEVLMVAIFFFSAVTLLAGIWIGILVVKKRARSIQSFTLIPFKIEFKVDDRPRFEDTKIG